MSRYKQIKKRVFEIISKAEDGDIASKIFDWSIMILIALSIHSMLMILTSLSFCYRFKMFMKPFLCCRSERFERHLVYTRSETFIL